MDTKAKVGLGVGGAVLALGAAVGVGALAANLAGGAESAATQPGSGQTQEGSSRGGGTRGGVNTAELASSLAQKLGVDEDKVAAALTEVMAAGRPSGAASGAPTARPSGDPSGKPSAPPTNGGGGAGRTAMLQTMAASLADKLDLEEATVLAALQDVWPSGGGGAATTQPTAEATK